MAAGRPLAVETGVAVVALRQDKVSLAACEAHGAVLTVGSPVAATDARRAGTEVDPVLRRLVPLAGAEGVAVL